MPPSHDPHAPPAFRLQLLGGLSVVAASGATVGQQRRRLALLALVASGSERGVTRDRIIGLLSPESRTESARHSLHQLLYYVRQQLGDDVFLGTDPLRLNPAVITSDVSEFEHAVERGELASAVALYRGSFLEGFHLNVTTFEEWVASERQRLAAMHSEAVRRLASESEARGDHTAAITWWRRLTALDPLSGSAALGLMRTLAAAGDASAALKHGRLHSAVVRTELGGRAAPEVEAFSARLPHRVQRLALLPLRAAADDPKAGAVAESLTREVISALTRAGIAIIGYQSVAAYATPGAPLREIARALDVGAIATGTLVLDGRGVELALEVANPRGENLWVNTTVVEAAGISRLAGDAARALASWILGNAPEEERPTVAAAVTSPEAYTSYLLGMREAYRTTATAMKRSLGLFEEAIVADSSFAPAHAGLGMALTIAVDYANLPADEAFRRADPVIARALALDATLSLAHLARARLLQQRDWNWKGAEAEYRRAIELEPSAQSYLVCGWFLEWYVGRAAEGVAMGERAVELEPASCAARYALAWRLRGANQLERAATEARIGLALDPTSIDGHWILAEVHLRRGELAQAEESARRYVAAGGGDVPANMTTLGEILARTGRIAEASAYAARLTLLARRDGPSLIALARTEMALDHPDRALTLLEQAVREHVFTIPFQPYWDPIRNDPRFQAVMRAQGLQ